MSRKTLSRAEISDGKHSFIVLCDAKWESIEQIDDQLVDILYSWTQEIEGFTCPDMITLIDSISLATQLDHLDGLIEALKERGLSFDPEPPSD